MPWVAQIRLHKGKGEYWEPGEEIPGAENWPWVHRENGDIGFVPDSGTKAKNATPSPVAEKAAEEVVEESMVEEEDLPKPKKKKVSRRRSG